MTVSTRRAPLPFEFTILTGSMAAEFKRSTKPGIVSDKSRSIRGSDLLNHAMSYFTVRRQNNSQNRYE